ncbi:MAG: DNA polymerase beta domain-containing protein [Anaerolineaceae bacterium]|nr:MAG: DNA polymerase beta domain-containing protein [Anaerolineaceae bacterium]
MAYNAAMATQTTFQVPPVNQRKRIPMRTIRAMAAHIVERFNPEEIILFGSHAYGKPDGWSDVDLLIVMDSPKGEMETALDIMESLPLLSFSVDVIVRSRDVLERRKKLGDWFLRDVTQRGKVLYGRTH